MSIYTILGIVFILCEIALVSFMLIKKVIITKQSGIIFVLTFALIYVMYVVASVYAKQVGAEPVQIDVFYLFSLVLKTVEAFVFKLDYSLIRPIANSEVTMFVAFLIATIISSFTLFGTVYALIKYQIKNAVRKRKINKNNGDIILGFSQTALDYAKQNKNAIIWDKKLNSDTYKNLIKLCAIENGKVNYKNFANNLKGERHFILFKDSNYSYAEALKIFERIFDLVDLDVCEIYLHLEANITETEAIKSQISSNTHNYANLISCFNKYELMARDFISHYPISKYLPREFYKDNFTIKKEKQINVVLIGFGKVNYELFKLMATNFEFAVESNKYPFERKQINYFLFDEDEKKLNNDLIFTLQNGYDETNIEKICNIFSEKIDVHSFTFYSKLNNLIDSNSYTFICVSLSSDLENISYASILKSRLGNKTNYQILARVKEDVLGNQISNAILYYGQENSALTHQTIINKELINISKQLNKNYEDVAKTLTKAEKLKWMKLESIKQYSNIYQALDIPFKLNILGFDIARSTEYDSGKYDIVSRQEFDEKYTGTLGTEIMYQDYFKNTVANMFAFLEHERWNSVYFMNGYKPMNFNEFEPVGDNPQKSCQSHQLYNKKHACLTNYYDGLDKLVKAQYLMDKFGTDYANHTVDNQDIKSKEFMQKAQIFYYDFQPMDNVYQNLTKLGYVIVKKK